MFMLFKCFVQNTFHLSILIWLKNCIYAEYNSFLCFADEKLPPSSNSGIPSQSFKVMQEKWISPPTPFPPYSVYCIFAQNPPPPLYIQLNNFFWLEVCIVGPILFVMLMKCYPSLQFSMFWWNAKTGNPPPLKNHSIPFQFCAFKTCSLPSSSPFVYG